MKDRARSAQLRESVECEHMSIPSYIDRTHIAAPNGLGSAKSPHSLSLTGGADAGCGDTQSGLHIVKPGRIDTKLCVSPCCGDVSGSSPAQRALRDGQDRAFYEEKTQVAA